MRISPAGIALIKRWEGCRLEAYKDGGGVWTIGYGHTSAAGTPKVTAGLKITQAEAEAMLIRDLEKYEGAVDNALIREVSQNQFDAMVSLCYNIGIGGFTKSSVVRHMNAGNVELAANSFLLWKKDRVDGVLVTIDGLLNRRRAERALFLTTPVAPSAPSLWARLRALFTWKG